MRIATWNVNSLRVRMPRVEEWLTRAAPDVLMLQETKLTNANAPHAAFATFGYQLVHHGEGGRNGVAIASRWPLEDVEVNLGASAGEARAVAATVAGIRFVSLYAPNGRTVGSGSFAEKLAWFDDLASWLRARDPREPVVLGGDFNVAPTPLDVWDEAAVHGGTHVTPEERSRIAALLNWGLVDVYRQHHPEGERFTWWDYQQGMFHMNFGMRIDLLLASTPLAARAVDAEIDRVLRKGKPTPSDHAPVFFDLDVPGIPVDAGWQAADERVAERRAKRPTPARGDK